jgi:transcriptional regulator with XRE-family HTH domain
VKPEVAEGLARLREAVNAIRRMADMPLIPDASFGQHVRRVRNERDMSLRKLAERAFVSPTLISKVETGQVQPPSEATIRRIARALDADEYEFLKLAGKLPAELVAALLRQPVEEWRRIVEAS